MSDSKMIGEYDIFEFFKLITDDMVPGVYPDRYYVSSSGRVFDTKLNRFIRNILRPDGYLSVSLNTNGIPKSYLLHRLVGFYFVPGDTSLIINHLDGNKNNPLCTNLEWATYSENNNHAFSHDLSVKGEDSPKAVITEVQAEIICQCLDEQKLSYSEIAKTAGVNSPDAASLISAIRRGESWRHISCKYNFSKNYKGGRYKILR